MLRTCVAYRNGQKLAEISVEEIHHYLEQPDCFVWVALVDPGPQELAVMRAQFHLHPLAVEDAQKGHQRPKIEEYGGGLFAVVHMIEEKDGELIVGEADIFVGRNYVLSVRNRAERGFQEVRARSEREPELLRYGPGYVLYALIDAVVDRYFPILDRLEDELETLEERIFAGMSLRDNIEALYALKQRLMLIKHAVTPLLEAIGNLSGARVPLMCTGMQEYFRDIADHLQRLNQSIESARDTLISATTVNVSMISLQEGEVMKRLAAYAALVAVPTLIAGIYGMNFELMPELKWKYGYFLAIGLMVGLDGLLFWKLRKEKWL
ncbi:magnesium transporter [Povalibacter uvarum]|uniref:Magnesium transport protein CorA n=1 Tax=Povalibacter uvarum TaxID=732238 RepID=A0A841HMY4_9GAMM|nr:magnesium/cobalt transporter CorA [Povalibacter uvarum]MBB6094103.1 magnesium transporter [Povalibacter uvarum]